NPTVSYNNAKYSQSLAGTYVNGESGTKWTSGSMTVTLNGDGSNPTVSYNNAKYSQSLTGTYVNGESGTKWTSGSVTVTLNGDGSNPVTEYSNAKYSQSLAGTYINGESGTKWTSGSVTVTLNGDGSNPTTVYSNAKYTQSLSGSVEGLSNAVWKSGSTVTVTLNGDSSNPTQTVDYSNAKYTTEQIKTLSLPEPAISGEYYNDHGWGHQTSGFTMTYYQFDNNGDKVEIQVKVASDEQSYVLATNSSTNLEVWVDGERISTDSSSSTGWFTWSGDADSTYEFAQNYANGVLEDNEYHFTDTYTVTVQNNTEAGTVATTAVLDLDNEEIQQQLGYDKLSYEVVVNPSNIINGQAEIKTVAISAIDSIQIQTSSTNLSLVNSTVNSLQFNYTDGAVSSVSQYESEMYISDNVVQYKNVLGGVTTNVATGVSTSVLDPSSPVQATYVKDTYVETVGTYISTEGVDLSNCIVTKTDTNGTSHELKPYYAETETSNGEKILYYDLAEQNRQETIINEPSTTTSVHGYTYETKTMEEALAEQGYVKGVDYDSYEIISGYSGYTPNQIKLIKEDTLSDGEIIWSADFDGNGEREFSIDSMVFDPSKGSFITTAGLILTDTEFTVTGNIEVPAAGEGTEPEEVSETLHNVSASINGDELTLKATNTGDTTSKVAITFGAEQGFSENAIANYQFSNFYAGTDLTFYEASSLDSVNKNVTELKNSTVDAGDITKQDINVKVAEDSVVHLSKDTTLTQLASTIAENGLKSGNATVTNTIAFTGTDASQQTLTMVANLTDGQSWKNVDKTYSLDGNLIADGASVSVFGGTFEENKGIVDYGGFLGWHGDLDLNSNVTNYSIEKNGFVRATECVGGFLGSIVGVVVDPIVQITTDIVNGKFNLNSLASLYTGGLVGGLTDGIASAINGDGFGTGWNEHYSNNVILNWSASMMLNKTYDDVVKDGDAGKAATMGYVAVAAIAFTVLTGGMGAAAFIPALGGAGATAVFGGVALAGATATALGTASLVATALVTSYLVGTSVFNASVAFENGDIWSGCWNLAGAGLAFLFPVSIGGAAKNASFALQSGATTATAARAAVQAKVYAETLTKMAKAGKDILSSGDELANLVQKAKGLGANTIDDAFVKFGIGSNATAIKSTVESLTKTSASAGNTSAQLSFADKVQNLGKQIIGTSGRGVNGVLTQAPSGILGSLGNVRALFGGYGGVEFVKSLQSLTSHMYTMAKLNIAMNVAGEIANPLIAKIDTSSWFGNASHTALNFVFGSMGQSDSVLDVNLGSSLQFGLIMNVGMPFFQGAWSGIKGLVKAPSITTAAATEAISGNKLQALTNMAKGEVKTIASGIWEEGVTENLIQLGLTSVGMSPQMAEVFSEFLSPDGNVNFTNSTYMQTINNSQINTSEGVNQSGIKNVQKATNALFNGNALNLQLNVESNAAENGFLFNVVSKDAEGASVPVTTYNIHNQAELQNMMLSLGSVAQSSMGETNLDNISANLDIMKQYFNSQVQVTNNLNLEALTMALGSTLSSSSNQSLTQEQLVQNISNAYSVAATNNSFKMTFAQQLRTGLMELNTTSRMELVSFVSKYSENGHFSTEKLAEIINKATPKNMDVVNQAFDDILTLSALNNISKQTNLKVDINDIINKIQINEQTSNLQTVTKLTEIGVDSIINSANIELLKSIADKINTIENIDLSSLSLTDMQNLYASLAIISQTADQKITVQTAINSEIEKYKETIDYVNSINKNNNVEDRIVLLNQLKDGMNKNSKEILAYIDNSIRIAQSSKISALLNDTILDSSTKATTINNLLDSANADIANITALLVFNQGDLGKLVGKENMEKIITKVTNGENIDISVYTTSEDSNPTNSYLLGIDYNKAFSNLSNVIQLAEKEAINEFAKEKITSNGYKTAGANLGQVGALIAILSGMNMGAYAEVGFGKTLIAGSVGWIRSYMGRTDTDLVLQNSSEALKYYEGTPEAKLMRQNGANVYMMGDIVDTAQNHPDMIVDFDGNKVTALERFKTVMGDTNAVRIWLADQYGFLGTTAENNATQSSKSLQDILKEYQERVTKLTIADEVHKYMENSTQFIMSGGNQLTLATDFTEEQKQMMQEVYQLAKEYKSKFTVNSEGKVLLTNMETKAELDVKIGEIAKTVKGVSTGKINSMVQAMFDYGKDKYQLYNDGTVVDKLVTMNGGQAESNKVLQDYYYAYSAAMMELING
ncbi:MAG: hypothetical protein WCY38_03280, partial [Endomicrobiia bacterium]